MNIHLMIILFTNCFILYSVYLYMYALNRQRFLGLWCLAGTTMMIKLSIDFILISYNLDYLSLMTGIKIIEQAVVAVSGLFMIMGTHLFYQKPIPKWFKYFSWGCLVGSFISILYNHSYLMVNLPAHILLSASMILIGMLFLQDTGMIKVGQATAGLSFIVLGIIFIAYPFLRQITWFLPWLYSILSEWAFLVIFCLLIYFLLKTRKELAESEERFRLMAENAQDIIYRYSIKPAFSLEYMSPAVKNFTGYSPEDFYSDFNLFSKIMHPDDSYLFNEIKSKDVIQQKMVFRLIDQSKNIIWVEQRSTPVINKANEITGYECIARDITENKKLERHLEYLSHHDHLTGLGNRHYFEEKLSRYNKQKLTSAGVVVCDIDGLKLINDTLGHSCGDDLIKEAGKMISSSFGEYDVVARIGGDEFSVIMKNCEEAEVINSCSELRKALHDYNTKKPDLLIYLSIGYAYSRAKDLKIYELFNDADNIMYAEKLKQESYAKISIINNLMKIVTEKEKISEMQTKSMQELIEKVGTVLKLSQDSMNKLKLLAKYHDIGKVGILKQAIQKKSLIKREQATLKKHCEAGYRIAKYSQELTPIADLILKHHEWWNGEGYPLGLKEEEIPLECRILAIVRAYISLKKETSGRRALSHAEALKELNKGSGTQFDPTLLKIITELLGKLLQQVV